MSIPSPIKALLVCPGHLPFNGYYGARKAYNRGLVIDLTGGRSVVVVVTEAGTLEQRGASQEVYALTPIFWLTVGHAPAPRPAFPRLTSMTRRRAKALMWYCCLRPARPAA